MSRLKPEFAGSGSDGSADCPGSDSPNKTGSGSGRSKGVAPKGKGKALHLLLSASLLFVRMLFNVGKSVLILAIVNLCLCVGVQLYAGKAYDPEARPGNNS